VPGYFVFLKTEPHFVAQAGIELMIFLPQPLEHWDYKYELPYILLGVKLFTSWQWGSKKRERGQALVAHTCNPSYSGGRGQEDCVSKPAQGNS
jgi:hypothetical protein